MIFKDKYEEFDPKIRRLLAQIIKEEEKSKEERSIIVKKKLKWKEEIKINNSDKKDAQKGRDILAKVKNKKKKENKGID